jgi:hypothetical protein
MNSISIGCPSCKARIRSPIQLIGQSRPCPKCGFAMRIRPAAPESAGPLLVADGDSFTPSGVRSKAGSGTLLARQVRSANAAHLGATVASENLNETAHG